jgi:hypothetical protein
VANGSAETWLISLAQNILDHEACLGCKYNAATALEEFGMLHKVLARLGIDDPREDLRRVAPATDTTAYGSTLTVTLDDGTVLRDKKAHEWLHKRQGQQL